MILENSPEGILDGWSWEGQISGEVVFGMLLAFGTGGGNQLLLIF